MKEVNLRDPEVFIDCYDRSLHLFKTGTDAPIINQVTELNRPKQDLTQLIPVGRLEHQSMIVFTTVAFTLFLSCAASSLIIYKTRNTKIKV